MRGTSYIIGLVCLLFLFGCSLGEEVESDPVDEESQAETMNESEESLEEAVQEEPREHVEEVEEVAVEPDEKETNNQGDYNVYIAGEVTETEDKIVIEGKSNLIPGARVVGEVSVGKNVRYFLNPSVQDYDFLADTSELVDENGDFYMEIEHPGLHNETEVSVKFHFDGQQNDDVIRHYGDRGQNLEGPYIYQHQVKLVVVDQIIFTKRQK